MATNDKARPVKIGVIGARRVRHGIGPFVAMHLAKLGADVAAIAGTSEASVAAAQADLRTLAGISPRGYTSVPQMFAEANLDAVAICSPDAAHALQLRQALEAGLHVLCEKPLVFAGDSNPAEMAEPLVAGFAAKNLVLAVNEQWPYTLPGFDELYPGVRQANVPPREFRMLLCPGVTGADMIPNSAPHVLSMLFALHGTDREPRDTKIEDIACSVKKRNTAGEVSGAQLRFRFTSKPRMANAEVEPSTTQVIVDLRFAADPPRPARYAIDGHGVDRAIEQPGYQMLLREFLGADLDASAPCGKSVPLRDPLPLLLANFLKRCREAAPSANSTAVPSLRTLWQLFQHVQNHPEFSPPTDR